MFFVVHRRSTSLNDFKTFRLTDERIAPLVLFVGLSNGESTTKLCNKERKCTQTSQKRFSLYFLLEYNDITHSDTYTGI